MSQKQYTMHVISHTHWDREWYRPFQHFRMRLVDLIDELLKLMERNPEYRFFHMDGQTIVLDDYLAIRPENEERLRKLVREGRILIGPWYNQPDEFLVSGEALIRNLMLGRKMGDDWGNWMGVGYVPDCFGHISQFPQLMRGFGVDNAVLFRGITTDQVDSEFTWRGSDGSEVLCLKMPDKNAYSNFYYRLRTTLAKANQAMGRHDVPARSGSPTGVDERVAAVDPKWLEQARQEIAGLVTDCVQERPTTSHLLFMDGVDHIFANPLVPAIIRDGNAGSGPGTIIHSTLPDYVKAVRAENPNLGVYEGELRISNRKWNLQAVLAGVMSSRIHLKQAMHELETLLERWAEPFSTIAWMLGKEYPRTYIELAWKYLMQNHPHDSICGCSLDQVHKDMVYRFDQARLIAQPVVERSLQHIADTVDTQGKGRWLMADRSGTNAEAEPRGVAVVVFNPLSWPRTEVVEAEVNLPNDWNVHGVVMVDADGKEVPSTVLESRGGSLFDQEWYDIPVGTPAKYYRIAFLAEDIPSVGYRTFRVQALDTPFRSPGTLVTSPNSVENEHIALIVESDGSLTFADKATERVYSGGMVFEDGGDYGDGWNYRKPQIDTVVTSLGSPAHTSIIEDNHLRATFRVETLMSVPASAHANWRERSLESVDLKITSLVTLAKGSRRIDIVSHVDNSARDHRLRVLFPVGTEVEHSNAEGAFDVLTRPVKTPDCRDWREPMPATHPQKSFVDASDAEAGLTVINSGLPEYEIKDNEERTVALSLMRSVQGGVGGPDNQEQGQLIGRYTFRYAVHPHEGDWRRARVWREAWAHNTPVRAVQTGVHSGSLPLAGSFADIGNPCVVLSALKKADRSDSIIARVFNITPSAAKSCKIAIDGAGHICETDLNEEPTSGEPLDEGSVSLDIGPKRIVTLMAERRARTD